MSVRQVREAVAEGGLFARDRAHLVMLSGGRDSTCLLDVAVALAGAERVCALHVNYGLRPQAHAEQRHCEALCRELGVELQVVCVEPAGAPTAPRAAGAPAVGQAADAPEPRAADAPLVAGAAGAPAPGGPSAPAPGNLHAWARELRYAQAARIAGERDALIATGHTASDQVETILYRLAASPGRRALLGMAASEGRLIRPLLGLNREQTAAYCRERGLRWCEDESNEDQRYARARVRVRLIPALNSVHPAAEANVLRTAALLREETEVLDGLVDDELAGKASIALARLRELPAALARMVVVRLAENATGGYVPQAGERVQEILALAGRSPIGRGGRAELHLGGHAGAVIHHGELTIVKLPPRA